MKKILWGIALLALQVGTAQAALLSRLSGQAYYDTVLDITWLADANYAKTSGYDSDGLMNWASADAWINSLNTASYLGASNWRLPTTSQPDPSCDTQFDPGGSFPLQGYGYDCTGSEMGHLFNVDGISSGSPSPFANVKAYYYWSGTPYAPDTTERWDFAFNVGLQTHNPQGGLFYAWAVRSGDIALVPLPAAAWLFGGALAALVVIRRRLATA